MSENGSIGETVTLTGTVEDVRFYNPANGYTVLVLDCNTGEPVIAVGSMFEIGEGETVRVTGKLTFHPTYGEQINVEYIEKVLPSRAVDIERYLASGFISGIGPHLATLIVKHFGDDTLSVMEQSPERLLEVSGIGSKKLQSIVESYEKQKAIQELMLFLTSVNISASLAHKIYKQYGSFALQTVKENPYLLAYDLRGVGFKTADKLAASLGIAKDHPSRIEAAIQYVLAENSSKDGHVCVPRSVLVDECVELIQVGPSLVDRAITELGQLAEQAPGKVFVEKIRDYSGVTTGESSEVPQIEAVYLATHYHSEQGFAKQLRTLVTCGKSRVNSGAIPMMSLFHTDDRLTSDQAKAVEVALSAPVSILTGGPGTGKSFTIKTLILKLEAMKKTYALAAPTGRAAKRITESTGRQATTIHRLIGYVPGEGEEDQADEDEDTLSYVNVDLVVIDEVSMLDIFLAKRLIKAIKEGTHILLVGDIDQLPSVGAGNVLRDLIHSNAIPVTRLSAIFRQESTSEIITNAHLINQGSMPQFEGNKRDFFIFPAETEEKAVEWVEDLVCDRIPRKFGFQTNEIQVLSPMYAGLAGVNNLNKVLQEKINPPAPKKKEKAFFGTLYRDGDRVMQLKNNYPKGVFNGDLGYIQEITPEANSMVVNFDGRGITYEAGDMDELSLAYCVTVHKFQGSESPCIVDVLLNRHSVMLQRNLLYTGITRAKKVCVLVSNRKAVGMAVNNNRIAKRYTGLIDRLTR